MTIEQQFNILRADGCTEIEAQNYIKGNRVTIFTKEDFENNFEQYMEEWFGSWNEEDRLEEIKNHQKMIDTKIPLVDWGIIENEDELYYIMYEN